jgi:hypothetical protein
VKLEQRPADLLAKVRKQAEDYKGAVSQLRKEAQALIEAGGTVEASASGSDFGYHAELYYRDFEKPPLGREFNVEWGGINGPQPGWMQKSRDDVKCRIEELSGVRFDKLEEERTTVVNGAKGLCEELLIELAPLHTAKGLAKEKVMLDQLEELDWADKAQEKYCAAAVTTYPNITRDSNAAMQGTKLPAHDYFEGIAVQGVKTCDAVEGFWKMSERLLRQLAAQLAQPRIDDSDAPAIVRLICQRFHSVAIQLAKRHAKRATLNIADEYDVQDLLHALLRLHFDDVRAEESTPSFGGGGARMDFLLKEEQIVLEAKMTRSDLKDKEITDELIQDVTRYKSHPDCKQLVCIVYDPAGLLKNPTGIVSDIEQLSTESLAVEVQVVPKR